jgi:hypothetical protein
MWPWGRLYISIIDYVYVHITAEWLKISYQYLIDLYLLYNLN